MSAAPPTARRGPRPNAQAHTRPIPSPVSLPLGAHVHPDGTTSFLIWAPAAKKLAVQIEAPIQRTIDLEPHEHGYHLAVVADIGAGARYRIVLPDGTTTPDPASRYQPEGVHGPSEIVATEFAWRVDSWPQPDLRTSVIYEMHIGTFTAEGTFDAAIPRLRDLADIGITAIEIMPIAQFPGSRNWGYDGVLAFAAQNSYGGPPGFKRFIDAAHGVGLAVVLDVVYNHVGPEGNYLPKYGPYFTSVYHTPWGDAVNVDESGSDEVRRYFIESALQWIDEFRVDALRVDAIHAIIDRTAQPFLRELTRAVHDRAAQRGRSAVVIAESDLGDPRVIRPEHRGGLGFDAQWLDDFHHSLRTLLTREDTGYYVDFGTTGHFARACRSGFVYAGEHSRFRGRRHGAPGSDMLPRQFVVYAQNHDQVGNRMRGDRLSEAVTPAQLRLAAAAVLLSPFVPMLFMGEEYGTRRPFPYFVSHGDPGLIEAVREGRREEFASFSWQGEPPDPAADDTFRSAVLDWQARDTGEQKRMLELYRTLLALRNSEQSIRAADAISAETFALDGTPTDGSEAEGVVTLLRRTSSQTSLLVMNFAAEMASLAIPAATGGWRCVLDTESFGEGPIDRDAVISDSSIRIAPHSAVLLLHDEV